MATTKGNYISAHQMPVNVPKLDNSIETFMGFKDQNNPKNLTGCAMGYKEYGCLFPAYYGDGSGGSLLFPVIEDGTRLSSFKIFLPIGTASVGLLSHHPQNVDASFVIRYGEEPERSEQLTESEYSTIRSTNGGTGYAELNVSLYIIQSTFTKWLNNNKFFDKNGWPLEGVVHSV